MKLFELITLRRDCAAVQVPSGDAITLPAGSQVRVTQHLGGSYTVLTHGYMARIADRDADALGEEAPPAVAPPVSAAAEGADLDKLVWEQLKTIYDPEIPVNIVELGLVYLCQVTPLPDGGSKVKVQMTLTAPGCGMGDVLRRDAEAKIRGLPGVKEVDVEVVMDPPWDHSRMSEAAKLQLGLFDY